MTAKDMRARTRGDCEFFLSEIFLPSDDFAGHVVELMRSASHIRDFHRLFAMLEPPSDEDDMDEIAASLQYDSLRIVVMNFAASQLREALKLFAYFKELPLYSKLKGLFTDEQKRNAQQLSDCVDQFQKRTGLLYSILKPLRDKTFHYDPVAAKEWVRGRMNSEKEPKPPFSSFNPETLLFGPGIEYDESLYSQYLFWSGQKAEALLKAQTEVWKTQQVFLDFARAVTETLLNQSNVARGRKFGWFLPYRYGFKLVKRQARKLGSKTADAPAGKPSSDARR